MEPQLRFTRMWLPAQPVVVSVLAARVGDRVAVEDLVQEVALAAFQQLEQYDESRSFTAWVLGIAQHKAIDWLRRNGPKRLIIRDEQALATLMQVGAELDRELSDRELALHGCLDVLQGRAREVVHHHYVDERPVAEIAITMNLSVANIKVMLYRVREALRACVEKRLSAESH
ncbi:MAG TPA: RNA polymerase sigma factor [Planctomycetota bacterium]|jgi:RNA polymerase sigma-70 factor (ECF subfamily)|nr:RNA polymerase sigma factor [Planctomycetota bacterium]